MQTFSNPKNPSSNYSYDLILQNMGLIKKCVSQIKSSTLEFEDLVQEAVAILLPRIQNFDPSKGSLSTFIWTNVKQPLLNSTQVLPEHLYRISIKIKKAKIYLESKGEEISAENIAGILGVRVSTYKKYVDEINCTNFVDLDECFSDENKSSPEETYISNSMCQLLIKAINTLPENQKQIITLHYNLNNNPEGCLSLREIAKILNVNYQTVANIEAKGIQTIKAQLAA